MISTKTYFDVAEITLDGADDETRTRDPNLGKVVLYQLSYVRLEWWALTGSNRRPPACKAGALPAELSAQIKVK